MSRDRQIPDNYSEQRWAIGGDGPGAGAMGKPLWMQLLEAGATPTAVQQILTGSYGHATIGDAAGMKQAMRGAFTPNTWSGRDAGKGHISGTGTMRGGIQAQGMGMAPTKDSEARRDLADYYQRRREMRGMEDELAMRRKFLEMLGVSMGGMPNKVRSSETTGQLFNNAGRPQVVPITTTQERDVSPQERAAFYQSIMGLLR